MLYQFPLLMHLHVLIVPVLRYYVMELWYLFAAILSGPSLSLKLMKTFLLRTEHTLYRYVVMRGFGGDGGGGERHLHRLAHRAVWYYTMLHVMTLLSTICHAAIHI